LNNVVSVTDDERLCTICILLVRENLTMELKYTKFQIALETIGLLLLVGMIILIYTRWNQIPQQIPMHYNAIGEIDNWGSKEDILFLPVVSILLYAFLTALSFFPQIQNIPILITDENKESVYHNIKNLYIFLKIEIVMLLFLFVYYITIAQPLPIAVIPIFIIILLGTSIFFIVRIIRS